MNSLVEPTGETKAWFQVMPSRVSELDYENLICAAEHSVFFNIVAKNSQAEDPKILATNHG